MTVIDGGEAVEDIAGEDVASFFAGAMPKAEIGALKFMKEFPLHDGRGVVVAILDTGVDPGAPGLSVTSDGKPKILDVIDCTGSGDVDTSKVVKPDADNCVLSLSGRKLKLNPKWANPTGVWRVGSKRAYDLFPRQLRDSVREKRRKAWDVQQRAALATATAALTNFDRDQPASKLRESADLRKERLELEARLAWLKGKAPEDPGPTVDCVVWHDGSVWRAALDTTEMYEQGSGKGALCDCEALASFRLERRYGTFPGIYHCNYVTNVYSDGALLSVVMDVGAHGTHVAGITAAYFPEDPELNGIAPGAQIISCKIGDARLGSMETLSALSRALVAVLDHGCDLINMSYGEPTSTPDRGRFMELANEIVNKHRVIFVASAGNSGPALSTVGAPGGTASALLGVGAYVSPELAAAGHSVRSGFVEGQQYTWSSRGPTYDGHLGVAFSAPGGAIAPVPQWTRAKRQLMNGTSMASPNACGGIAVLLSALKACGHHILPAEVRNALENTAIPLGGEATDAVLTYGRGLIQIDQAFLHLQRLHQLQQQRSRLQGWLGWHYSITVDWRSSDARGKQRGIYIREPHESRRPQLFTVNVNTVLPEAAEALEGISVEEKLLLESSAPWVSCPAALLLHSNGRTFDVEVDPTGLPQGLHYAEVAAYDASERWRGPLFRVPVTVIKPIQVAAPQREADTAVLPLTLAPATPASRPSSTVECEDSSSPDGILRLGPLLFQQGTEHRRFLAVPEGATWAELTLRTAQHDTAKSYMIRATQLVPSMRYSENELRTVVSMAGSTEYSCSVAVVAGCTMEVTLAQAWNSLGPSTLDLEVAFHGVVMEGGATRQGVTLDGSEMTRKVTVRAPLRRQRVLASAKLQHVCQPLRPVEVEVEALLGPRDTLPDNRVVYRMLLTYKATLSEAGKVKPEMPMLNRYLYDGVVESHFYMIHDSNKRLLECGDTYPEETQLKKGDYVIRVALRHDNLELLEKLRGMPLILKRKLDTPITVPVYASLEKAVAGASSVGEFVLDAGDSTTLFLGPLSEDKLPKDAKEPGRVLVGELSASTQAPPSSRSKRRRGRGLDTDVEGSPGRLLRGVVELGQHKRLSGPAPASLPLIYIVPPECKAKWPARSGADRDDDEDEKAEGMEARLKEMMRDATLKLIKDVKLDSADAVREVHGAVAELRREWPDHLPVLQEQLRFLLRLADREKDKDKKSGLLSAAVKAADEIAQQIDGPQLMEFLAIKCPDDMPDYKKQKRDMGKRRSALLEALEKKCIALLDLEDLAATSAPPTVAPAPLPTPPTGEEESTAARAEAEAATIPEEDWKRLVGDGSDATEQPVGAAAAAQEASAAPVPASPAIPGSSPPDQFLEALAELRKWVDTAEVTEHAMLHARSEARAGRYARALKALDKLVEDDKARREVFEMRSSLLAKLGWQHWEQLERAMLPVRFPASYPLF